MELDQPVTSHRDGEGAADHQVGGQPREGGSSSLIGSRETLWGSRWSDGGARRYHAQRAAGETPWSAYTPSQVTHDDVAQARVPASVTEPLRRAAVVLVICVDLRAVAALDRDLDRVGIVGGASIYPLVWNILLAARQEGFGGTITTMAVAEEPALKRLLGIPEPFAVAAVLPMGKPVKQPKRLTRVSVAELTHLEHWHGGPLLL